MLSNGGGCDLALANVEPHQHRGFHPHVSNKLLCSLKRETLGMLLARMELISLKKRQIIEERNFPLSYAYFLESGAASLLAKAGE
jgi:hypothetical protein